MEEVRVDRWLWAVRIFKSRTLATDACKGGHVKVNGAAAKPATTVRVGDRVEAFAGGRRRMLEVAKVIGARVGAPPAAECVLDTSPAPPERAPYVGLFGRDPGAGRPTKRERRQTDRLRGR